MPIFEHPLQLYAVTYPDGWESRYEEETGGVIFVNSRAEDACALSLSSLGTTGPTGGALEDLRQAAGRVGVELLEDSLRVSTAGENERAYGEGDRAGAEAIGTRFRFWVIRHGVLKLFVTQLGPGAVVDATRAAADESVNSIIFPEVMPPTIGEFRDRVMGVVAREYPQVTASPGSQWSLELKDGAGETIGTVGLENLYRDCLLQPESAGAIIREYLDQLLQSLAEVGEYTDMESVRERLLPMLKSQEWIDNLPGIASAEFAPGLLMCFAIDSPTRVAYVTEEMLGKWDLPLERVQGIAQDNLARKKTEMMLLPGQDERAVAVVITTQDGYDATRLVLPTVRDAFSEELGDEYLVGIPNRDFLIAFSERDAETAAGIIRQVKHDFQRMNHPISGTIYRARPDSIEPTDL
jgi:uncharacterized protein YtpQ (UPF0354 family)